MSESLPLKCIYYFGYLFRQITRPTDSCPQPQETLTELRTMQIPVPNTQPPSGIPIAASAPAQYTLDPNMPTTSTTTELSPIHDYEIMSTLGSYAFGGTLQRYALN